MNTEEMIFLGTTFAPNARGNADAEKVIKWLKSRLREEMDRSLQLELDYLDRLKYR